MAQPEKQKEPPKSATKTIFCPNCGVEIIIKHSLEEMELDLFYCRLCDEPISIMVGSPCTICFKGI